MASTRLNALDQALDIAGSLVQTASMISTNEPLGLGSALSGQTGSNATISAVGGGLATITGLTGMTSASIGNFLSLSGTANVNNTGTFLIVAYNSATSVDVANAAAVFPDGNSGSIVWSERSPYSLQDDINYIRTDRAAIKGVNYYADIPAYQRPTAVGTNVPANLANIASKTLDAHAWVINRMFHGVSVAASDQYVTLSGTGLFKHADAIDRTGVPISDGADAGALEALYVEIIDPLTERALVAVGGITDGYRIFGYTRAGTTGVSPNSVEVEFRAVPFGASLSSSVPYTWDGYQPTSVDMYYGFRERADQLTETAFRTTLVNGIVGDAGLYQDVANILTTIGTSGGDTSLAGLLTNTGAYYPFYNLPDVTPSVVEALNTLNEQIGNRNYTGAILTDGYTITQSLQQLANAISGASFVRIIERLTTNIPAGTPHTLPGAQTYTQDATNNGQNLIVYTRGLLRDPGPLVDNNDYEETSTTQVTFYSKLKTGDHINFLIYA
jgi:hypothetical protein